MNILEMLKNGKTVESLTEDFFDALDQATAQYEDWKKEEEEKARKAAERELEKQYKARKIAEAKSALGAAMIEYLSALDMVIDDKTYADVDLIIEALPQIKVIKSGGRWF